MSCTDPQSPLSVVRGASKTFLLTVRDPKKNVVDLTSAKIWFTVKNRVEDAGATIALKNANAGGVDGQVLILTPQTGVTKGQFLVFIDPANTAGLDPDASYWVDAWVQLAAYLGTSTAVGSGTLTDSAQTFVVNKLTGGILRDSTGAQFPILSNTSTVITVTGNPAAGTYSVFIGKRYQVLSNRGFVVEPAVTTVF